MRAVWRHRARRTSPRGDGRCSGDPSRSPRRLPHSPSRQCQARSRQAYVKACHIDLHCERASSPLPSCCRGPQRQLRSPRHCRRSRCACSATARRPWWNCAVVSGSLADDSHRGRAGCATDDSWRVANGSSSASSTRSVAGGVIARRSMGSWHARASRSHQRAVRRRRRACCRTPLPADAARDRARCRCRASWRRRRDHHPP